MAVDHREPLLAAAAATGAWRAISEGGVYNFVAWGTWNGATAQLQWSPDGGTTAIDIDAASLTANGGWSGIPLARGHARCAISGAGGSTSISARLDGVS